MATATWNGGAGTWAKAARIGEFRRSYAWENQETAATFAGTGGAVTVSGTVIAHGVTINSTGYSFSGGSLTVTAGGIQANESVTIDSRCLYRRAAGVDRGCGKNADRQRAAAYHHQRSDLQRSGQYGHHWSDRRRRGDQHLRRRKAGWTDPGGLRRGHAGRTSNFAGDITVNAGAGPLNIAPTGGASAGYSGAWFGGGRDQRELLGHALAGRRCVELHRHAEYAAARRVAVRSGGRRRSARSAARSTAATRSCKTVRARPFCRGTNTYSGNTIISNGALQANFGVGIPATSFLIARRRRAAKRRRQRRQFHPQSGHFRRTFQWAAGGGGFSAGAGGAGRQRRRPRHADTLAWGSAPADVGSKIVGTLKLSSTSSQAATTFRNSDRAGQRRSHHSGRRQRQLQQRRGRDLRRHLRLGGHRQDRRRHSAADGRQHLRGHDDHRRRRLAGRDRASGFRRTASSFSTAACCNSPMQQRSPGRLGTTGTAFQWGLGGGGFSASASSV